LLLNIIASYVKKVLGYNENMNKLRVAVLRGGPSHEYDVSLETGRHILSLLNEMQEEYEPKDILISRSGEWYRDGLSFSPEDALLGIDVVFNAMHGQYGEDGEVQSLLEELGVPFTGSYSEASRLAMDKERAKQVFYESGLYVPRHELIELEPTPKQMTYIFNNYVYPVIVKPASGGSSLGTKLVHTFHELGEAIEHALQYSKKVLVEEFIRGREATCGVVENARGEKLYALLPIEIKKHPKRHFFDYEAKYSGETEEICPGSFSQKTAREIENQAKKAHVALGLHHYSRSDFIITPKGKIYILETNTLPGFTQESLFPKALHAVGWHPKHFVDHIIKQALERHA